MKAAMVRGIEDLVYGEFPTPKCGKGELLVQVKACAVCGTDVKVYHYGHRLIKFPRITGHELSGEIKEIGEGVSGFEIGDRVQSAAAIPCGECYYCRLGLQAMCDNLKAIGYHYDGGFAEYILIPERVLANGCVNKIPAGLSYEEAALAEPVACCINGQEISGVGFGDSVLIIGAGPMGCIHAQLARVKGASLVIISDVDDERLKMAEFTSADRFVNPTKEKLAEVIKKENDGRLADHVIVAAGSGQAQIQALEMAAKRGSVNFFGGLPKTQPTVNLDTNLIHYGELKVVGTHGSAPRHNKMALKILASGAIKGKDYITSVFPLAQIKEALTAAENCQGLKVVVKP
jgi:L-iditol 2-dehydrogenase